MPKEDLVRKMTSSGFRVIHARYHNALGTIGWCLLGKVMGKKAVEGPEVNGFDLIMPIIKRLDRFESSMALSLLAVGRKEC
jgi:hypothetical protein